MRRRHLLLAAPLLLALAAGCRTCFTDQVRSAGLRWEAPPSAAAGGEEPGTPAAPARPRRTFAGYLAQGLLPGALILDAVVSLLDVVGLAATVAGWVQVAP